MTIVAFLMLAALLTPEPPPKPKLPPPVIFYANYVTVDGVPMPPTPVRYQR
jgi:hypothetical protein